jgi:signal transduction histidine kinase
MDSFIQQTFLLLTTPPGNLVYHLTIVLSIAATIQTILVARRADHNRQTSRIMLGLFVMLFGQFILFLSTGLAWQGIAGPRTFLPLLDRAVFTLSILWIAWLWGYPEKSRPADVINAALNLILVIFLIISLTRWNSSTEAAFNNSLLDWGWLLFSVVGCIAGLLVLFLKRPEGWGTGAAMLFLALIGLVIHMGWGSITGDFAAPVRLALLCAFPLLPNISRRLHVTESTPTLVTTAVPDEFPSLKKRFTAESPTIYAWLQVSIYHQPEKIPFYLCRAMAQTMLCDVCMLISMPGTNEIIMHGGYDLVRDQEVGGTLLSIDKLDKLAEAVQNGRPYRWNDNGSFNLELKYLADAIDLGKSGSVLALPLKGAEEVWGAIILMSPYTQRDWTSDDQNHLIGLMEPIMQLLKHAQQAAGAEVEAPVAPITEELQERLADTQVQLQKLDEDNQRLLVEIEKAKITPSGKQEVETMLAIQQETSALINQLQAENEKLKLDMTAAVVAAAVSATASAMATAEADAAATAVNNENATNALEQANNELHLALQEVAVLQNTIGDTNARLAVMETRLKQNPGTSSDSVEVIASMAQDLRQPMASIMGYTDVLLSESVGILATLQRKFLERVKAATERMRALLDDLIQVVAIESGPLKIEPSHNEFGEVIDQAIAEISTIMRSKNLTLRVDMPEHLPQIETDRDSLNQIVSHLLQNASTTTPAEGTIRIKVELEEDDGQKFILLKITDFGGGISTEDLPRVFSKRYRADAPLIQGIGDSGIGLSIARTLVEAQGGRIWVDSEQGKTSTFSTLFPLVAAQKGAPEKMPA